MSFIGQVCLHIYKEFFIVTVVSASDVTPTDRWRNVWCIWYTYLETLQGSRFKVLLFVTYSIIQDIISSEM